MPINFNLGKVAAKINGSYVTDISATAPLIWNQNGSTVTLSASDATQSSPGLMTSSDKTKLDGIQSNAVALGETSSTAYRGDRGKVAYDHISLTNNPHVVTKAQVGLGNVDNTSDLDKPVSTATQTALDAKVDKVSGKGLSTNDFSSEYKDCLDNGKYEVIVEITPTQLGTGRPSPSNVRKFLKVTSLTVRKTKKNIYQITSNSVTVNGITFTIDSTNGTITVNGTATDMAYCSLNEGTEFGTLPHGPWILTGCPEGGSSTLYSLKAYTDGSGLDINDYGSGTIIDEEITYFSLGIVIQSGVTVSNLTFRPMIRRASDNDNTFEPYEGETFNISFSEVGCPTDVYGGTLNLTTGEFINSYRREYVSANETNGMIGENWDLYAIAPYGFNPANFYCNKLSVGKSLDAYSIYGDENENIIHFIIPGSTSSEALYTLLNMGPEVVYETDVGEYDLNIERFTASPVDNLFTSAGIIRLGDQSISHILSKTYITAGQKAGTTLGTKATAEGNNTTASKSYSHAEGNNTTASGQYSHSEGYNTTASGNSSHAEGSSTTASGQYSHAGGLGTKASASSQTAIGSYNVENTTNTNAWFIVGKGSSSTRANAFRIGSTESWAGGTMNASGADYAEMFEWEDGNPENEDRRGRFVTLCEKYIKYPTDSDSYILGIVSGFPTVLGDVYDDQWQGMYEYDVFGSPIYEDVEVPAVTTTEVDPETGEEKEIVVREAHIEHRQKLNPNYDSSIKYIPRSKRPEWSPVGLIGKLVCIDDGSGIVDGYVKPSEGGIATNSYTPTKYRVMERLDDSHIRIYISPSL